MMPLTEMTPHGPPNTAWPDEELEHLGRCPVCLGTERVCLHTQLTDRLFHSAPGEWTMHRCLSCSAAYLDPRPNERSIGKAYIQYFTHQDTSPLKTAQDEQKASHSGWKPRLRHWLRASVNSYRNAKWGMNFSPANQSGKWWVPCVAPLSAMVESQMRDLPARPPHPGAKLLDVGCGNGAFLLLARAAGWVTQGVDFDPQAVAVARRNGLEVHHGGLEQMANQRGTFDLITCSHVIEHVHEPIQWLQEMHALLRPGGTLWLQTPNVDSYGHRKFGRDWRGLEPPRHLTLFMPRHLHSLLKGLNFHAQLHRLSTLSAMPIYLASEALQRNQNPLRPVRFTDFLKITHLILALKQSRHVDQAEFITIKAKRIS